MRVITKSAPREKSAASIVWCLTGTVGRYFFVVKNNRVENLEWTTYSYNNYHALQHELRKPRGTAVMQYTVDGDLIEVYDSIAQAARETGICARSISLCINCHTFSAGGYSWERLSEGVSTIL